MISDYLLHLKHAIESECNSVKIHFEDLPTQNAILLICIGNDENSKPVLKARQMCETLFGKYTSSLEFRGISSYASETEGMRGYFGIFLATHEYSTIAHEAFHTTHRIMDHIGMKFDINNHEVFAYLNGHIVGCVDKLIS